MEGGQTQQAQPPAASVRWLQFAQWLQQQRGGPPEEAVSEVSTSDVEDEGLPPEPANPGPAAPAAAAPSSSNGSGRSPLPAARTGGGPPPAAAAVTPSQLARHATALVPRLPDCRTEMRLTSDSCSRARQEMTVMLAAPGLPLHQAPVLTAKQASALMCTICEPLLSLPVGRLTRKLSAPTKLQPTEDRGVLSLWLLPDDSLSLVWQSAQQLGPAALADALAPTAAGSSSSSEDDASSGGGSSSSGSGAQQLPQLQQSCSVAVWEELAHFPPMAHLLDDAPVVTIHMLRGDVSGRSFYIRVRNDVAEANLEAATAAVPDASRVLQQQRAAATAASSSGGGAAALPRAAAEVEAAGAPRMYFWLTERDLGRAVYSLGRLKSLLKRPPTLSKRSGVPERQLQQLGAWVLRADQVAAEQQRQAAAAAAQEQQEQVEGEPAEGAAWEQQEQEQYQARSGAAAGAGSTPVAAAAAGACSSSEAAGPPSGPVSSSSGMLGASTAGRIAAPLPLLQSQAPGLLLGQHGMSAAAQLQGGMSALLPPSVRAPSVPPMPPPAAPEAGASSSSGGGGGGGSSGEAGGDGGGGGDAGPAVACGASTVSATAAALYQDHRFNVVCPCTISVVVGMKVQAAGADPALLPAEASQRARAVAERQAKSAVDRSGRQRIEERLAEVVIRNIRAQRNRARAARQQHRDSMLRQQQAERALSLARQATGRGPPASFSSPSQPKPQAQAQAGLVSPFQLQQQQLVLQQPAVRHQLHPLNQQLGSPTAITHHAPSAGSPCAATHYPLPLGRPLASQASLANGGPCDLGPAALMTPFGSSAGAGSAPTDHHAVPPPPASLPCLPSGMLPSGRVTIGNLQSLLTPQSLDAHSSQSSSQAELEAAPASAAAAAAATAAGDGRSVGGSAAGPSGSRITVPDLADMLNNSKLE